MTKERDRPATDAPEHSLGSITFVQNRGGYQYLWMKRVTGVNLDFHCIDCLLGSRDHRVEPGIHRRTLMLRPAIYYLCGVGWTWSTNAHLAFTWFPGASEEWKLPVGNHAPRLIVRIENFSRIAFSEADIDPKDPHLGDPAYRTCRNWQFGHLLLKHGAKNRGKLR